MGVYIDITPLLPHLCSTSNIALVCTDFSHRLRSNGFPIKTSEGDLCLSNYQFYKYLGCPYLNKWAEKELFRIIEEENVNKLKQILEQGVDPETTDRYGSEYGFTALIFAAWSGKPEHLKLLLQSGAKIESKSNYRSTALAKAAWNGRTECLQLLLDHEANIEAKDVDGDTALILTAYYGNTECMQLLLKAGANIKAKNNNENTALIMAALRGKPDCLKILLQYGAKVDPKVREKYPHYADLWQNSSL